MSAYEHSDKTLTITEKLSCTGIAGGYCVVDENYVVYGVMSLEDYVRLKINGTYNVKLAINHDGDNLPSWMTRDQIPHIDGIISKMEV